MSDSTAAIAAGHGREGGEAAGGHKEVHHRVVEHGCSKRIGHFVLVVMMVAGCSYAATSAAMASTAA